MAVKDTICQMALSHIGSKHRLQNYLTDKSLEAEECKMFLPFVIREVLEKCRWPESTVVAPLNLIAKDPDPEWKYSYQYPSDCAYLAAIKWCANSPLAKYGKLNGLTDAEYRVVSHGTSSKMIYCNIDGARIEYTQYTEDLDKFSATFIIAASYLLALYLIPSLSRGEGGASESRMLEKFNMKIQEAKRRSFNESKYKETDDRSTLELSRGGH